MRKRNLSASSGTRSSLSSSFTASATHCKKPPGPTRLGPTRLWMRAATRRSAQEKIPAVMAAKLITMKATAPIPARETNCVHGQFAGSCAALRIRLSRKLCILPIDLRRHDVERCDQGDEVGDHDAA